MKKYLLLGVAFAALVAANPAIAADMPVKAPVYKAPVAAVYSWTGCYAGGNIGYSWGHANTNLDDPGLLPTSYPISLKPDGLIGGAQIGCNWQVDNKWVYGLEADFQGSAEKDSANRSDPFSFDDGEGRTSSSLNQTREAKILWFGTLRGRVGGLLTPTILLYGTGGLAYGKINASGTATDSGGAGSFSFGDSKTKFGWTLGAGVEGAIPNSRDWTWKLEYLYIDFGSLSGTGTDPIPAGGSTYRWDAKVTDNILRVGLNYRFH